MSQQSRGGQVLRMLIQAGGACSGQEMALRLGTSRAAVAKIVAQLREQGFDIQAAPRRGYLLVHEPDMLLPARVEALLKPGSMGLPYIYFQETDSTNLQARQQAEAGAPHGACLAAEFQSAGRGRMDRRWQAPPNSCLLFSLLLRPRLDLRQVFVLNNLISLALCLALEKHCGLSPSIKWPNDVFLDGRKLVGILTEITSRDQAVDYAVVGVGVNVNQDAAHMEGLDKPAISLKAASGHFWDRAHLLASILEETTALYNDFMNDGAARLRREYEQRSMILGLKVEVAQGGATRSGLAKGFGPDGSLILEEAGGGLVHIHHGDVSLASWGQ